MKKYCAAAFWGLISSLLTMGFSIDYGNVGLAISWGAISLLLLGVLFFGYLSKE